MPLRHPQEPFSPRFGGAFSFRKRCSARFPLPIWEPALPRPPWPPPAAANSGVVATRLSSSSPAAVKTSGFTTRPLCRESGAPGGAPGPRAVVIPSDFPYGGRKSGNAVGFVSKPALAVVITAELALMGFWKRAPRAWRWQQHANWRCDPEPALSASFQAPFRMGPYPDFVRVRKAGQGPRRIKGSSRR